ISQICRRACIPSAAASSMRPRNGDTMYAGISAARMACAGENTSVTLMRIPSSGRRFPASIPAGVIGTFTTALSPRDARYFPCSYIATASGSVVSSDTSPSTSSRIERHAFSMSPCSFARSVGFVVTPLSTPHSLISRISSMFAVSKNNLMAPSPLQPDDPRLFRFLPTAASRVLGCTLDHEVDHGADGLIEVVVRDHRDTVGESLALDVLLHLPDVSETFHVAVARSAGSVSGSHDEVTAVQLLIVHTDNHGDGEDPVLPRLQVNEAGDSVGSFNDNGSPLDRGPPKERLDPHSDRRGLFPEPDDDLVGGSGRRFPERLVGVERGCVQRGHQLSRKQPAHDLTDGVGGHDPDDPQAGGELGSDRRLADAGGPPDQQHERRVEGPDLLPAEEVLGVAVAGDLLEDANRHAV